MTSLIDAIEQAIFETSTGLEAATLAESRIESVAEGAWCQNCEYLEKPEDFGEFRCQSCGCAVSVHINVKVIAS